MERAMRDQAHIITRRIVEHTVDLIYERFGGVVDERGEVYPKEYIVFECLDHAEGRDRVLRTEEDRNKVDLLYVHTVFKTLFDHLSQRLKVYDDLAMERWNYEIKPMLVSEPPK
jgi:hypothetical protein